MSERVLTYECWNGQLNNVRMSFECAVVMAHLLRRTLLVSTKFSPISSAWMVETLDLARLRRAVPLVCPTDADYPAVLARLEGLPPGDVLEVNPYPKTEPNAEGAGPGTSVFCLPGFPPDESEELRRLGRFAAGRYGVRLPSNHERYRRLHLSRALEHFYTYYFLPEAADLECRRLVRDYVRYRPEIVGAANAIASGLGAFCAMHVRRGDFLQTRPRQCFSAGAVVEATREWLPRGARLYVATDEADPRLFDAFRAHYDVVFFRDVAPGPVRNFPGEWVAACEQLVCAAADVFVGTMMSTYSGYITRLRGYRGAPDQSFRFTDGTADSRPATGEYSWRETVRAGVPLWGREYREGWSC